MLIGATSDLHGFLPPIHRHLDLLLVAGDLGPATTKYHRNMEYAEGWMKDQFANWLRTAPCQVLGIAGNHDFIAEKNPALMRSLPWTYLCDEGITTQGLVVYGTPWTPSFGPWAFMASDGMHGPLVQRFEQIPSETEILITHGPAFGHGDQVMGGARVGSRALRDRIVSLEYLKLHVFGHIHEEQGYRNRTQANVSHVDLDYQAKLPIQEFEIR